MQIFIDKIEREDKKQSNWDNIKINKISFYKNNKCLKEHGNN